MNKARNSSIDIFRLFFAIGVVMGHTFFLYDVNKTLAYFVSRVIPRMSVPFFFCITGYYFIKGLMNNKINTKKQLTRIIEIYAFWTLIYYTFSLLLAIKNHDSMKKFVLNKIRYFIFDGSYYHFWYFTALIYTIIIVSVVYKLFKMKGVAVLAYISMALYIFAFLGTKYCGLGYYIPPFKFIYNLKIYFSLRGIFCMGLPFFMTGYFLNRFSDKIEKMSNKKALILFIVFYGLYVEEAIFALNTSSYHDASEDLAVALFMIPALSFLFINLLKHPMPKYYKQSVSCRKISNFMYYIHPLLIQIILTGAEILSLTFFTESVVFIIVFIITMIVGYILSKFEGKLISLMV